jgi:hypothetical protein
VRETPLTPILLANLDCFTPDQIEKISNTEPDGFTMNHKKARFGLLAEETGFRDSGMTLFKVRNKHCVMGDHEAPLSDFSPNRKTKDGLTCSCKPCRRDRYKARWKADGGKRELQHNKDRMQISAFQAMFQAARLGGYDPFYCLMSAVVGSCDDVFNRLPEGSLERWLEFKK